jgi:hypothetical protein
LALSDVAHYHRATRLCGARLTLDLNSQINTDSSRDPIRWYVERGVMQTETDLGKAVDRQYVGYALGVLGRYE